jgi:hypothetical protein
VSEHPLIPQVFILHLVLLVLHNEISRLLSVLLLVSLQEIYKDKLARSYPKAFSQLEKDPLSEATAVRWFDPLVGWMQLFPNRGRPTSHQL